VDAGEGLQGVGRGKGIPRPGDSRHRNIRTKREGPFYQTRSIAGLEQLRAYTGPVIELIKAALTETALNIARGADRQMYPAMIHIRRPGKTGMGVGYMRKPGISQNSFRAAHILFL
jgi:hypothetical protein